MKNGGKTRKMTLLICVIKHNNNKTEFISPWNYNFFEYRPTTPYVKHWNRGTFLLWMFFSGSNVQSLSLLTRSKERALPPYRVVEFCYERHVCVVWLAPIHIRTASLKMGQHFLLSAAGADCHWSCCFLRTPSVFRSLFAQMFSSFPGT